MTTTAPPKDEQIDAKFPWWDGNWLTYEDYKTRVELRADACKKEDLQYLGPRLAANLTGRAFDTLGDIQRAELRKEDGWSYLLKFLEGKRGRAKVDLLGDMFNEFFLKREAYRRDGEEWPDYELRFRALVRKMDRAVQEANMQAKIPSELYGWFLLNIFMRFHPSDAANLRGKSSSYKMEDVMEAVKIMWSSGGLGSRDQESKSKKTTTGSTYIVGDEPNDGEEEEELPPPVDEEMDEIQAWHDEALVALAEDTSLDGDVLANFREARRALDHAKNARGFYPLRQPGKGKGKGGGKFSGKQGSYSRPSQPLPSHADKICMRCGKRGHIAQFCPQRPDGQKGAIGFVGFVDETKTTAVFDEEPSQTSIPETVLVTLPANDVAPCLASETQDNVAMIYALGKEMKGRAIIDSGASDNIVGAETLQDLADCLGALDFCPEHEISVDRDIHKQFVFGNNATSAGLGLTHINAGLCGQQVPLEAHMVEGGTPFLLSSKFLYDVEATINFKSGVAVFKKLSNKQFKLERTPSHHLMIPLTAFAGNEPVVQGLFLQPGEEDVSVAELSEAAAADADPEDPPVPDPKGGQTAN